ncbi:MAG: beta-lactamase family protein [Flavobacteriales bacterium]|nr:beta-lactamase family protein [Flavobacteriales bacterium]
MKKTSQLLNFSFLSIALALASVAYSQKNAIDSLRIDSLVKAKYDQGLFNGSILVKSGDQIIYKNALGWANFETKDTLKLSTPTRLASITKSLTAVCVLKLIEEGKIDLNEDIHTYLPEIEKTGITIHHLLSHTSGIVYVNGHRKHLARIIEIAKLEGENRHSNKHVLMFFDKYHPKARSKPGAKSFYSNIGYSILASLIERVSQTDYGTYLKQNIFDPLNMEHSSFFFPAINQKDNIQGAFSYKFGEEVDKRYAYYDYDEDGKIMYANAIYGDKHVYSTVEDMEKFNTALLDGKLISNKYLDLAMTLVKLNSGKINNEHYGYGFMINGSKSQNRQIYHTGGIAYFSTMNMMHSNKKYQIILLQNARGALKELIDGCYAILEGKSLPVMKQSKKMKKAAMIFNEKYKIEY